MRILRYMLDLFCSRLLIGLFLSISVFVNAFSQSKTTYSFLDEKLTSKKIDPRFLLYKVKFKTSLYCAISGKADKPILLLIPGKSGEWSAFRDLLEDSLLNTKFLMIAIDRPGKGKSDYYSDNSVSIKDEAYIIKSALTTYKKNKQVIVLGMQEGALTATQLAADYPEWVNRLILLEPKINPIDYTSEKLIFGLYNMPLTEAEKLEPYLSRITQPTLFFENNSDKKYFPGESYAYKMLVNCKKETYLLQKINDVNKNKSGKSLKNILVINKLLF